MKILITAMMIVMRMVIVVWCRRSSDQKDGFHWYNYEWMDVGINGETAAAHSKTSLYKFFYT